VLTGVDGAGGESLLLMLSHGVLGCVGAGYLARNSTTGEKNERFRREASLVSTGVINNDIFNPIYHIGCLNVKYPSKRTIKRSRGFDKTTRT
jgi:hypothetical protein